MNSAARAVARPLLEGGAMQSAIDPRPAVDTDRGVRPWLAAAARSRAVHFVLGGALLFAVVPRDPDPSRIDVVSRDAAERRAAIVARGTAPASPREEERRFIEDEVLYREALRLGLDRADGTMKQHLVTKALLFAEDLAGASRQPTPADLRAFYDRDPGRFTVGATTRFLHVFGRRRDTLTAIASDVVAAEAAAPGKPPPLGDAFPSVRDVAQTDAAIGAMFGDDFALELGRQPVGQWSAPLPSKLGFHLVKVLARTPGHAASFDEVKARLALDWSIEQRHAATAAFLTQAYARYHVYRDGELVRDLHPTTRIARRADPSAED